MYFNEPLEARIGAYLEKMHAKASEAAGASAVKVAPAPEEKEPGEENSEGPRAVAVAPKDDVPGQPEHHAHAAGEEAAPAAKKLDVTEERRMSADAGDGKLE